MPRVQPINQTELPPAVKIAIERHIEDYNIVFSNTQATLSHSLLSYEVYMQVYPLYESVVQILGDRIACLYALAISNASSCLLCASCFRKKLNQMGWDKECLPLSDGQKALLNFATSLTKHHGNINDHVYNSVAKSYSQAEMVILIAFAGQMVATTIFNNVAETEIDDHLSDYVPSVTQW
ncbi:MAG: hypothetical protein JNM19_15265 [Chitinophagaceae bacterium]|nr:hypothetical protein [Chitinophagaceae bacterium]